MSKQGSASDDDRTRWRASVDDLIGGWCVVREDGPATPAAGAREIASFTAEATARRIADLHNASLVTGPAAGADGQGEDRPAAWLITGPHMPRPTVTLYSADAQDALRRDGTRSAHALYLGRPATASATTVTGQVIDDDVDFAYAALPSAPSADPRERLRRVLDGYGVCEDTAPGIDDLVCDLLAAAAVPTTDRVRDGVCLDCGGAVLASGEHLDPARHLAALAPHPTDHEEETRHG